MFCFSSRICASLLAKTAFLFSITFPSVSSAQTLAEVLDTTGRSWSSAGAVTNVLQPSLTHDGSDALRLDPGANIQTELEALSVVDCYYRSEGIGNYTTFSFGPQQLTAAFWKQHRMLSGPGALRMANTGVTGRGPLFLDEVQIRPATFATLAEALDLESSLFSFSATANLLPFAEPEFAPDGQDAALLRGPAPFTVNLPAPGALQFRIAHPQGAAAASVRTAAGQPFLRTAEADRVWIPLPTGQTTGQFEVNPPVGSPVILDQVKILPRLPLAETLGAPGLNFSGNPQTLAVSGPGEEPAVLLLPAAAGPSPTDPGTISATIPGPCLLRFLHRGEIQVTVPHLPERAYYNNYSNPPSIWSSVEIRLFEAQNSVRWRTSPYNVYTASAWLKSITMEPFPETAWLGEWLNQPGYKPELLPGIFVAGSTTAADRYLWFSGAVSGLEPLLRMPVTGPVLVSMGVGSQSADTRLRVDGGPWHGPGSKPLYPQPGPIPNYVIPVAATGPRRLEAGGSGILANLTFTPLQVISPAEAVDAASLVFTTSPELPWTGYGTPASLGFAGSHAACGGQHDAAGDPWLETTLTGPGYLSFRTVLTASNPAIPASGSPPNPTVMVDGVPWSVPSGLAEIPIGPGLHAVRWVQPGSQVLTRTGTLWWLDAVSFSPVPNPLPGDCDPAATATSLSDKISALLQTPGRFWTTHAPNGTTLSCAWQHRIREASFTSLIEFPPSVLGAASAPPFRLQTAVRLPAVMDIVGENLDVMDTNGKVLARIGPGYYPNYRTVTIPGNGTTTLTLQPGVWGRKAILGSCSILESINQIRPDYFSAGDPTGWTKANGSAWHLYQTDSSSGPLYRLNPGEWLETTITGPCWIPYDQSPFDVALLPDHGYRNVVGGTWIHFPGPQRFLARVRSNASFSSIPDSALFLRDPLFVPALPLASGTGLPKLLWTTGGDIPCAVFRPGSVAVPHLLPGETTWMEASIPGPGTLDWEVRQTIFPSAQSRDALRLTVLINKKHIDTTINSYSDTPTIYYTLHLGPGLHTFRWESYLPANAKAGYQSPIDLQNLRYRQLGEDNIVQRLGDPELSLLRKSREAPRPIFDVNFNSYDWIPSSAFPASGAIRSPLSYSSADAALLFPIAAEPGVLSMDIRMDQTGTPGSPLSPHTSLAPYPGFGRGGLPAPPAFAAPFPQQQWTMVDRFTPFPVRSGFRTFVGNAAFIPDTPVSIGEALGQPELTWTSGGSRAGLWTALSGPGSRDPDPGGIYLAPIRMGEKAWVETVITGPAMVTTRLMEFSPTAGLAVEMDGLPFPASLQTEHLSTLTVPPGSHRLRWTATPLEHVHRNQPYGIRGISIATIANPAPDPADWLDSPNLTWSTRDPSALGKSPVSHDGMDALRISAPPTSARDLKILLTGPGTASWWASSGLTGLDSFSFTLPSITVAGSWKKYQLPIPAGDHAVSFPAPTAGFLDMDEFHFDPVPSLGIREALDLAPATVLTAVNPTGIGAAPWTGIAGQPEDALLLMPGESNQLRVEVPLGSTLSVRVRGLTDSSRFSFDDPAVSSPTGVGWRTFTSSPTDAYRVTIPLTADGSPVFLDQLIITPPPEAKQYFPWLADYGLTAAWQDPASDPDHDGFDNALEYSLDSNPLEGRAIPYATATAPGQPVILLSKNSYTQAATATVTYWKRTHQTAVLETAMDPSPGQNNTNPRGWEVSTKSGTTTSPGPPGWQRIIWQSPDITTAGARLFIRVRYEIP